MESAPNKPLGADALGERHFTMNSKAPQADTLVALPGRGGASGSAPIHEGTGTLLPGAQKHIASPTRQHMIAVGQEQITYTLLG